MRAYALLAVALLLPCVSFGQPPAKKLPTLALKDVSPLTAKAAGELKGRRVFGKAVVLKVEPATEGDSYFVHAVDSSSRSGGIYVKWSNTRWIEVVCVLETTEDEALSFQEGSELTIAGDVSSVNIITGRDFISGGKGRDETIELHIKNAKVN